MRGWGKGEDYVVGEGLLARLPNHTWNAVEIEGKWFLIDCFWSRTKGGLMLAPTYVHCSSYCKCYQLLRRFAVVSTVIKQFF